MTPQNIIDTALDCGLDLIAITDHNSAENVQVAVELAQKTPLTIIPGMEVTTVEEVHLLCLFATVEQILDWQEIVYQALPDRQNQEDVFGPQIITNQADEYIAKLDKLLLTATDLTVQQVVNQVTELGGLVIPAHVDKKNYSLLANLGFIPPGLNISIVEISDKMNFEQAITKFNQLKNYSVVTSSDAHYLDDISKSMSLNIKENNFSELINIIFRTG
ncbi:PHP domain-containing protein [Halanaerobaculum tunisiense]